MPARRPRRPQRAPNARIAVIPGASAGIGEAITRGLAVAGARLVINARRKERLDTLARELGGPDRVAVVAGDAADEAVIDRCLDAARDRFGGGKGGREADPVGVNARRGPPRG